MFSIIASTLRFVFRTIVLIAFLLLVLFPTLMRINHHRRRGDDAGTQKADEISVRLGNRLAWLFGIKVHVRGEPAEGAVLLAANHISWLDIPVLHSACAMGFVAKAEISGWPLFGYIARSGSTIFHQRGSHDSAADVSFLMAERLNLKMHVKNTLPA